MIFILTILVFLHFSNTTEGACPDRFIPFNDTRCFYISNVLATYHEAKKICGLMDAQLYTPNLDKYELEGKWLFKYIYVPFFWVAAEKNITNLSTQEGHWVDGNDVKKNMTFMLWDYNHRYNLDHNKIIFGKTIKTAWTHLPGMLVEDSARLITHQDESHRLMGHKSAGRFYKTLNESLFQIGQMANWHFDDDLRGHKEQMWKLEDGKLLNKGDDVLESMGRPKMKWYNFDENPLDWMNSDGPWAFGPEDKKGRFYVEHTGLNGRLGYFNSTSCLYLGYGSEYYHIWDDCLVMLHIDPDSDGYQHPLMFKKTLPDKGDCPSCSNGWFRLQIRRRSFPYFEDWEDVYLSMGTERSLEGPPYGRNWINLAPGPGIPPEYEDIGYGLSLQSKKGRYGRRSYGNVWDVEKMSLPHIRRKTGDYARPYGQNERDSRGLPWDNWLKASIGAYKAPSTEFTTTIEERTSDMQRLLPHVWGDHTYKSSFGHAYLKTHKYLWYHCAVVKESGLWPFTWIPAQCDLMRFPFVCSTVQTE